jgi:hypothetical protein
MVMSPPPAAPALTKVQGKKRQMEGEEDVIASPRKPTVTQTRQKRVLPSRTRRGGPGIGSTDVDQMILDAQQRRCAYNSSVYRRLDVPHTGAQPKINHLYLQKPSFS